MWKNLLEQVSIYLYFDFLSLSNHFIIFFSDLDENKQIILKNFDIVKELCELEKYVQYFSIQALYYSSSTELLKYQLGFCAQWCLDNVFTKKGRKFSYKKVDYSNLNVILNVNDKTEFLKLSPDGLSVKSNEFYVCVCLNFQLIIFFLGSL